MGVDLSKKTLIFNGYTLKELRSLSLANAEDTMKLSDRDLYGKRRILYTPDPNATITLSVPTGSQDELILLAAAETGITGAGYYKDTSVAKYARGLVLGEIGVVKGELTNDGETDAREFTLHCTNCREALA